MFPDIQAPRVQLKPQSGVLSLFQMYWILEDSASWLFFFTEEEPNQEELQGTMFLWLSVATCRDGNIPRLHLEMAGWVNMINYGRYLCLPSSLHTLSPWPQKLHAIQIWPIIAPHPITLDKMTHHLLGLVTKAESTTVLPSLT
jgi:hypothetical protein